MAWSARHLLDVENLSASDINVLLDLADEYRAQIDSGLGPADALVGHHVALLFAEPSTRTRLSFELAARRLGAQTYLLDPPSSSMVKGETLTDTVRNLDAIGFDMLVVRHHRSGAPWVAARHFGGHVLNAGDGWHAHPTQALLDLLTLRRAWGGGVALRGRKVLIVGDILHSRVARSNIWTLTQAGADVWLCGPPAWIRGFEDLASQLPAERRLTVTDNIDAGLRDADAVMGLRVQKERMSGGKLSLADYLERYQIDSDRMAMARPGVLYLHPGPINEGVEVTREVCLGPRSLVLEQVRNGAPVRMAAMSLVVGPQASSATRDLSSAIR